MADYGELARAQVQKHFPKFGSFRREVTYTSKTTRDDYNPTSGVVTPGGSGTATLWVIFLSFGITQTRAAERERDDIEVLNKDRKVVFPAADLPFVPAIGDLIDSEGVTWRVMGVNDDPKPAHWALHARPLNEI